MTLEPCKLTTPAERKLAALYITLGAFILQFLGMSTGVSVEEFFSNSYAGFIAKSCTVFACIGTLISIVVFLSARNQDGNGFVRGNMLEDYHTQRLIKWCKAYPKISSFEHACIMNNGYLCMEDYKKAAKYVAEDVIKRMNTEILSPLELSFDELELKGE
jgi:hypothetical protein